MFIEIMRIVQDMKMEVGQQQQQQKMQTENNSRNESFRKSKKNFRGFVSPTNRKRETQELMTR